MQTYTLATLKASDLSQFSSEDLLIAEVKLALNNSKTRALVASIGGRVPTPPSLTGEGATDSQLMLSVKAQIAHAEELLGQLGGAADVAPKFEFTPGGSHNPPGGGVRPKANGSAAGGGAAPEKLTMTDQILRARGVKSLEELNAKFGGVTAGGVAGAGAVAVPNPEPKAGNVGLVVVKSEGEMRAEADAHNMVNTGFVATKEKTSTKKLTATEQVLRAKGVTTIAELNALPRDLD